MIYFLSVIESDIIRSNLEKLYITYKQELFYIAYGVLGNKQDAEDVIQTAFIRVERYIDEETDVEDKKIRGLIALIVKRLSYDIYNGRKKHITMPMDTIESLWEPKEDDMELIILRLDRTREIANMMKGINEEYIDILTLRYSYGYSNKEIAEIFRISESNVSTKIYRAKKLLKKVASREAVEV